MRNHLKAALRKLSKNHHIFTSSMTSKAFVTIHMIHLHVLTLFNVIFSFIFFFLLKARHCEAFQQSLFAALDNQGRVSIRREGQILNFAPTYTDF